MFAQFEFCEKFAVLSCRCSITGQLRDSWALLEPQLLWSHQSPVQMPNLVCESPTKTLAPCPDLCGVAASYGKPSAARVECRQQQQATNRKYTAN